MQHALVQRRGYVFSNDVQSDAVIIDEAAQAIEPSTLIPLCHGAKQVFLVGDPRQLPATVLSNVAVANDYDMSMFKRFEAAAIPSARAQDAIQNAPRDSRVPVEILLRRRVEGWTGYDDAQRASLARVLGVSSLCVSPHVKGASARRRDTRGRTTKRRNFACV